MGSYAVSELSVASYVAGAEFRVTSAVLVLTTPSSSPPLRSRRCPRATADHLARADEELECAPRSTTRRTTATCAYIAPPGGGVHRVRGHLTVRRTPDRSTGTGPTYRSLVSPGRTFEFHHPSMACSTLFAHGSIVRRRPR